ncbi:MAG: hypothetical protein ACK5Q5_07995 [Planctomycetaceae bacterium]
MKRFVPLLITAIGGFVLIVAFFIPAWQGAGEVVAVWFDILASIAFILGGGNLLKVHLKKISDRTAGWGYSGVTLLAFLLTLTFGLLKFGVPPAPNTEFYGESFAAVPLEEMPEFSVPGQIPARGDGKPLPASVRNQITQSGDRLVFRGWMTPEQSGDLSEYQDQLDWQAEVETLADQARPPEELRGRVSYHADHRVLGFQGVMTDAEREALRDLFDGRPAAVAAVDRLYERSHVDSSISVTNVPPGFQIPATMTARVQLQAGQLAVVGPMSTSLRRDVAEQWPGYRRVRPLSRQDIAAVIAELESKGQPFTDLQRTAVATAADTIWSADLLIQALNSAGIPVAERKTARQLLAERDAGVTDLDPVIPPGPAVSLTASQEQIIRDFAADPNADSSSLPANLRAAGEITAGQLTALESFLTSQPTLGQWRYNLATTLLKMHRDYPQHASRPTQEQLDWLLAEARAEYLWKNQVDRLFANSNPTKYRWSGEYLAAGSGLNWIYEYLFQPLTATMFAMLAFYVASAAFRAFRAKNFEAILLLGTAFIILVAQTPIGARATNWIPDSLSAFRADEMKRYIMSLFNTAGNRAIMIGIALGIAATSLKILLGVDRSYLGGGDE